jgi:superkiller protein 3
VSRNRPRNRILVALGVVLVAGCATTKDSVSEVQRLQARSSYEQGVAALGERQLGAALTAIQQATTIDPTVASYRNALGIVYLQLGRPEQALVEFQGAVKLEPDYAEAILNVGVAHAELQRWTEAVDAYQRAIRSPRLLTPDTAHQNLGVAFYNLRRLPEAEEQLRFAIRLEPQLEAAYYHLGLVLVAQDRKDEAKVAFRRTRQLAPNSPFGQAAVERLKALGEDG